MSKMNPIILARLIRLEAAGHAGPEQLRAVREAISLDTVQGELIQKDDAARASAYPSSGYLSAYEATAMFAEAIHSAIAWHAGNVGRTPPPLSKYHPDTALPAMFKDVWESRQLCDQVGMPYEFFAEHAVKYWESLETGRLPRPTQLCSPRVMAHVAALWADPYMRARYMLPKADVDRRFDPDNFTGDPVQLAVLRLVEERVESARLISRAPADVLADMLGVNISVTQARARFGDELVDQAEQWRGERDRDMQATLGAMQLETGRHNNDLGGATGAHA